MYEAVHARPDGDSTVARHAATVARHGFEGLVVRNHDDARADFDRERVAEAYGVDVVEGVEVRAEDPASASGAVGNLRPKTTVLLVHGGTPELNRFAVEQPRVDVLAHPMAGDGDVNHVVARTAADNGVRLEFDLGRVLRASGGRRVRALTDLRKLRDLVEKYDVPHVVSAGATSHLQVRAPRELAAVGEAAGFSASLIERGLAEWDRLAERNRRRQSEEFVEPGVRRGRDADVE